MLSVEAADGQKRRKRIEKLIEGLSDDDVQALFHEWPLWARKEQLAPAGDWTTWLMIGGRGSGKTRAGAEWVRSLACGAVPVSPIALVGETIFQARAVMVEGVSGILAIHPKTERPRYDAGRATLVWPNGAVAQILPANDPERFRGPQFAAAWCDELAKWPKGEAAWDMLQFGLRLGDKPRQLVTTTPKPSRLLKRIMSDANTVTSVMKSHDNAANLAPSFLQAIVARYEKTALGRQELDGEFVEEAEGALWSRTAIEAQRLTHIPQLERIVVAVDPPVTGHAKSDACGVVVVGMCAGQAYVLADRSKKAQTPDQWAQLAVKAYDDFDADCVVAEVNQGGDMVAQVLRQQRADLPVQQVRATRGKWLRAEPVAALYAQGRVHHCGNFDKLEDEMCGFTTQGTSHGHSPDRVDALVWAVTALMLGNEPTPKLRF